MRETNDKGRGADSADTPYFRFNRKEFASRYAHFSQFGRVYYPAKANDHPDVLREVHHLGGAFDVDTTETMSALLAMGVPPADIQFGLPVKPWSEVIKAFALGITSFVVDTRQEFELLLSLAPSQLVVRVSLRDLVDVHDTRYLKWGMLLQDVQELVSTVAVDSNIAIGVSFFLPKALYSSRNFDRVLTHISTAFQNSPVQILDIGGGLDDSYDPAFGAKLSRATQSLGVSRVIVEPGRNLLDPCIDLVTSVLAIRERPDQTWAFLDAGIFRGLLDAALIGRRFDITLASQSGKNPTIRSYQLVGPSADSHDSLGEYRFEQELRPGDQLVVRECGAYTWSLRTAFSGFSPPGWHCEP